MPVEAVPFAGDLAPDATAETRDAPSSPSSGDRRLADLLDWLHNFEEQNRRPLRVLHVGNIANNAYLNAKFLRSVGVEAHVLCYDYTHVMAMPEWEDIELLHGHGDDDRPVFSAADLGDYRRPRWFVSGPLIACVLEITALWDEVLGAPRRAKLFVLTWLVAAAAKVFGPLGSQAAQLLITAPRSLPYKGWGYLRRRLGPDNVLLNVVAWNLHWIGYLVGGAVRLLVVPARALVPACAGGLRRCLGAESAALDSLARVVGRFRQDKAQDGSGEDPELSRLIAAFDRAFPERPDRLVADDIVPYRSVSDWFRDIFRHYDIVQCYATDPIRALLAGKRPYVAFEHGTLRDFTLGDVPLHRLTALAYRRADHTFITNGDCLAYAERLGIERYSPIIHPVDVEQHRQDFGGAIEALRREIGGAVILFCPVRHDWQAKSTDVHLHALPLIKAALGCRVRLVLIRWGSQVWESEALLASLGCAGDVVWRPSMCRITMIKHLRAADVVLDQMALPHFGATAPQAIAAGTPVISSYDPASTRWIIPEPAPILPAFSPEEVAAAVAQALDPTWRAEFTHRGRSWTDRYHHPNNVIHDHLAVYRKVLEHERQAERA